MKLANSIVTITGPPDSGKSNLAKFMLNMPQYRSHLVYDPLFGFDSSEHNVIRPPDQSTKYRRYKHGNPELNKAADDWVINAPDGKRPKYFVIDEAGRLLPNQKPEGPAMGELNDFNAHYGVSVWLMGQRFQQINSDFKNKATHHFVMGYKGKNDKDYLKQIHEELPTYLDQTRTFGFTYVGPNGVIKNFEPVKKMGDKSMI